MTLNIANFDTLIAHLKTIPPENFHMAQWFSKPGSPGVSRTGLHKSRIGHFVGWACGTAACIAGHANIARNAPRWFGAPVEGDWLGLAHEDKVRLFAPWKLTHHRDFGSSEAEIRTIGNKYSRTQAIATLEKIRAIYLETGQVVVDWSASAGKHSAPDSTKALPDDLTSLLRPAGRVPA